MDQAGTLRELMKNRVAVRKIDLKPVRVISVTSGKGGVGKTNVVANLAIQLQKAGHRVLVLDGDFGLANMNIVLGMEAKHTIHDVITGDAEMSDVILTGPHGIRLIPASSGIFQMTQLSNSEKCMLMDRLEQLPIEFDILLIDTGAGISSDVVYLNAAASEVVVVATPEPTSIADAYALMKVASLEQKIKRFKLLVNMVDTAKEAMGVFNHLLHVSDRFLNINIEYLGHIVRDPRVNQAVMARKIVSEAWPDAPAAQCFSTVAEALAQSPKREMITGNVQFFWKTLLQEVSA